MKKNIEIDKLPSDVRAQYKRFKVMHAEKKIQRKAKDDFMSFTKAVWPEFIEGAHHRVIAQKFNDLANKKTWLGKYKYPKGKDAWHTCRKAADGSDGSAAYCSMRFHYAEQTPKVRREMCSTFVKQEYWNVASQYSYGLYLIVWDCD